MIIKMCYFKPERKTDKEKESRAGKRVLTLECQRQKPFHVSSGSFFF